MTIPVRRFGFLILAAASIAVPALHAELAPATAVFEVIPEIITPPPVDPGGANAVVTRSQPTAVALGNGFAVAWRDEKAFGMNVQDVMMNTIGGQLIDRSGQIGAQFIVDLPGVPGARLLSWPTLASLGNGRFEVAWAQNHAIGRDVFAQSFGANGLPEAYPRRIGDPSSNIYGDLPNLAGSGDGKTALAWPELTRDALASVGGTLRYNLLSFDAAGAPTTSSLRLGNGRQSENQVRPAVILNAAGIATAAWLEPVEGPNPLRLANLWSQRFNAAGVRLMAPVRLALRAADGVAIARADNDQTIVIWARKAQGGAMRLNAGRLAATGRLLGKVKDLGPVTSFVQPVLLRDANGSYALAWIDGDRLKAVHLSTDLVRQGSRIDVAPAQPELYYTQGHGFGAALEAGRLLLTWEGEMPSSWCPGNAIKAQIFELR
ncbi:MAG: hypothetical protein ABJC13_22430 [Acidobacteriota bacterium]